METLLFFLFFRESTVLPCESISPSTAPQTKLTLFSSEPEQKDLWNLKCRTRKIGKLNSKFNSPSAPPVVSVATRRHQSPGPSLAGAEAILRPLGGPTAPLEALAPERGPQDSFLPSGFDLFA